MVLKPLKSTLRKMFLWYHSRLPSSKADHQVVTCSVKISYHTCWFETREFVTYRQALRIWTKVQLLFMKRSKPQTHGTRYALRSETHTT